MISKKEMTERLLITKKELDRIQKNIEFYEKNVIPVQEKRTSEGKSDMMLKSAKETVRTFNLALKKLEDTEREIESTLERMNTLGLE